MEQPYRATELWQEVICGFRSGMPRRKKRVKMHVYNECFIGHEGVEWLLAYVQSKGMFGEVSRPQVERLMQKFLESDVIREVSGKVTRFQEDLLYQFVMEPGPLNFVEEHVRSPTLGKRGREYGGTCFTNEYAFLRCENESSVGVKQARRSAKLTVFDVNSKSSKLPAVVVAQVWKELTLARLLQLIDLPTLDDVLSHDAVDGKHIEQNVSIFFRLFKPSHQRKPQAPDAVTDVPRWVILAMRCLSKWPEGCSEELVGGMPVYSGFELDVLHSLVKYFASLSEPLISPKLYDLHMAVRALADVDKRRTADALQLCNLLLPQTNRMRVHRVLRMIHKAGANSNLHLSTTRPNRQVLLEAFSPVIIRPATSGRGSDQDRRAEGLVGFMSDNYQHLFKVPDELKKQVERQLQLISSGKPEGFCPPKVPRAFCSQVSREQYEHETKTTSHDAIAALLDKIAGDEGMAPKERKQKLKLFQREYPDIYAKKFPSDPSSSAVLSSAGPALR